MEEITRYLIKSTVSEPGIVRAWEEDILLPTYEAGSEEKNPVFLERRVYQGSSGSVYPYPVIERISDEKKDKKYRALFLENEYLKIMILPELGGRVHMAYDKVRERHFVYYNQVVKPALVGLTGPWISGGIEFNWPQHHRPSTFLPTEYSIEDNGDGSFTVWCNEVERMFRMKGMQGFTLHPGKAYLEINVKVYNRTPFPQTFLWWANPAVAVNESYFSVFPPDVHAVFDHGKRDVSNFPIATGVYYKQDYSRGVDISRYSNIPVPTSYMAIKSDFDFIGGYQEDLGAGMLHVADHHVSPGKKQWTWGCGDFGKAWDRNLTDEDGPYIELMTGVYTDNQPDFSWLQPGEEKSWVQYFMPYSQVGYVKNATKDAIVNITASEGEATVILYTTSRFKGLRAVLTDDNGRVLLDENIDISPSEPYTWTVPTGDIDTTDMLFRLESPQGDTMLEYRSFKPEVRPTPDPAEAAREPSDITSVEQLYLTGLHLEQYRHATYDPTRYYLEAIRRDPGDIRSNNAMGLYYMRKGCFAEAENFFRTAVDTLTKRNPNPYEGEPYYNLGNCLLMQGRSDEAYDAFHKAVWNAAWQDSGYFSLGCLDASRGEWEKAVEKLERSLVRNWHNHKARHIKAAALRKAGRTVDAAELIGESLALDGFNMGCMYEKYLLTGDEAVLLQWKTLMRDSEHNYIEYALDYAAAGMYAEAGGLLLHYIDQRQGGYPMVWYTAGYMRSLAGDKEGARRYYEAASQLDPSRCFPNRIEEVNILKDACRIDPTDAYASYYLGNFWYAARQYDKAVECWERAHELKPGFPTVMRNLALAYYNKYDRKEQAREYLEKAFALDTSDTRIFMELDQLYKKTGVHPEKRLSFLEKYPELVEQRDDLMIEKVTLINQLGRYEEARQYISQRKFHPWEGGEGKITKQYLLCHVQLAKQALAKGNPAEAIELLACTASYPENLGEGKLANAEENDIYFLKGMAYKMSGDESAAAACFSKATVGSEEPQQAFFYYDQQPDKIFYQGLAWKELGCEDKARGRFNKLVDHGKKHLFDDCSIDYFAVSLPDLAIWEEDLNVRNLIHCYYVMGLGLLGLGRTAEGIAYLEKVMALDINHTDCRIILDEYSSGVH